MFHGFILLLLSVQALGLYSFVERLGLFRLWVRAGEVRHGTATVLMFVAGTFDGFVTPLLGARCENDLTSCGASLAQLLVIDWAAIQAFTRVALALQALGLLCWSIALLIGERAAALGWCYRGSSRDRAARYTRRHD